MRALVLLALVLSTGTTGCKPKNDEGCRASAKCKSEGKCKYDRATSSCVEDDADEKADSRSKRGSKSDLCATSCKSDGQCEDTSEAYLVDDEATKDSLKKVHSCIASKPEHCRNAAICKSMGWCTLKGKSCVAGSDGDCRASADCASSGKCKLSSTDSICVPASDADCAASAKCQSHGACVAQRGAGGAIEGCGVKTDSLCKTVPACKHEGACTAAHTIGSIMQCQPASAADCAASEVCKTEGRCKLLDRGCVKM